MKFRDATLEDLPAIVALLADDSLGIKRENANIPLAQEYITAFEDVSAQAGNQLIVLVDENDIISGCLQLTIVPGITRRGMKRATIEGVRVHPDLRGSGAGTNLFQYAVERARQAGCGLVQLTTDKDRPDAHRFYEGLGFESSHVGMKLFL